MAIQYSGYMPHKAEFVGYDGPIAVMARVKDVLVAGGWTLVRTFGNRVRGTFTGLPANGQTATFDGVVYTFRTTINNGVPREVLIGPTGDACADNLIAAINAGPGAGTLYGSATVQHATCRALKYAPSVLQVTDRNDTPRYFTAAKTLNNFTLDFTQACLGGYTLRSGRTSQGLEAYINVFNDQSGGNISQFVYFRCWSVDPGSPEDSTSAWNTGSTTNGNLLTLAVTTNTANRLYTVNITPYRVVLYVYNDTASTYSWVFFSLCWLNEGTAPFLITDATNSTPIEITTADNHDLNTGDTVHNVGCQGNTAANGTFTVTKTAATKFTLNGSAGNGAYVADSGVAGGPNQLTRAAIFAGNHNFSNVGPRANTSQVYLVEVWIGQYHWSVNNSSCNLGESDATVDRGLFFGERLQIFEPWVYAGESSNGATPIWIGQIFDAFMTDKDFTLELSTVADGRIWRAWSGSGAAQCLWLLEGDA
jgi:hypothetical protein